MTASQANRPLCCLPAALLLILCFCFSASGLAAAQGSGPVILLPGQEPPLQEGPASQDPQGGLPGGLWVEELPPHRWGGFGLLEPGSGELPATVWQDVSAQAVAATLEGLPSSLADDSLRSLALRLLLSPSWPLPPGASHEAELESLTRRAQALSSYGSWQGLELLRASLPASHRSPEFELAWQQLLLLASDTAGACEAVELPSSQVAPQTARDFLKLRLVCDLSAEVTPTVLLNYELLREGKGTGEEGFFALADSLLGFAPAPSAADFSPFTFALAELLFRNTGEKLSLNTHDPVALGLLARAEFTPFTEALQAGEAATAAGTLDPSELSLLYTQVPASEAELLAILDQGAVPEGAEGRARSYRASLLTTLPAQKNRLWLNILTSARRDGLELATARLLRPLVLDYNHEPQAEAEPLALTAARVLAMLGEVTESQMFLALAIGHNGETQALKQIRFPLLPYILLSLPSGPAAAGDRMLMEQLPAFFAEAAQKRLLKGFTAAFWEEDPAAFLALLGESGQSQEEIAAFLAEGLGGGQASALLASFSFAGAAPLSDSPPARLAALAFVLRKAGFEAEAQAFARAALAAYRI